MIPGVMDIYGNLRFFNVPVKEVRGEETIFHPVYFNDAFHIEAVLVMEKDEKIKVYPVNRSRRSSFRPGGMYDLAAGDQLIITINKDLGEPQAYWTYYEQTGGRRVSIHMGNPPTSDTPGA